MLLSSTKIGKSRDEGIMASSKCFQIVIKKNSSLLLKLMLNKATNANF